MSKYKRPPIDTARAIWLACAEPMNGIDIAAATGIKHASIKPAIQWMIGHGHLIGLRRKLNSSRYCAYQQGAPVAYIPASTKRNGDIDFSALECAWPTSRISPEQIRKHKPSRMIENVGFSRLANTARA